MVDISALIVNKLLSLGFLNVLIFLLTLSIFYAILRRIKLLGENPFLNAVISFSIAFFVFAFPIISGINLFTPLSTYITQLFIFGLILLGGILISSLFYPNLLDFLSKSFQSRNVLFGMIALSLALFVTSGLVSIIYSPSAGVGKRGGGGDLGILVAGLIIAFVILLIASHLGK
ncbi:MAG: hypothetical protein QXD89_01135 [Candidatus Aenigmatarchaeota archaeon]